MAVQEGSPVSTKGEHKSKKMRGAMCSKVRARTVQRWVVPASPRRRVQEEDIFETTLALQRDSTGGGLLGGQRHKGQTLCLLTPRPTRDAHLARPRPLHPLKQVAGVPRRRYPWAMLPLKRRKVAAGGQSIMCPRAVPKGHPYCSRGWAGRKYTAGPLLPRTKKYVASCCIYLRYFGVFSCSLDANVSIGVVGSQVVLGTLLRTP